ncbi:(4Fe-4S)-binding protein [Pseudoflavitalea rhizosphaerae]|uniref:(4Fe-4S)-binding protein n=1 Tax=Pseudoflavitalea rhizosphaerae TaxID=1884793 RepID=UPI000F8E3CDA|nr:(4Fe-4S)-binding protein [Pseudoflavitalea rhizosphaerae]
MQYKLEKPIHGSIGTDKYQVTIEWRNGTFIADEPVSSGGKDTGPDPYTLLLSSLATCTLVTLRMYIDRKGWSVQGITVNANMFQAKKDDVVTNVFDRDIQFTGELTPEQKDRLLEIAAACPVSKILEGNVKVRNFVFRDEDTVKKLQYTNGDVTVVWKPELCKHSGRCVTQLPLVFNLQQRPWVNMSGADSERILEQVKRCPTGALTAFHNNNEEAKA